MGHWPDRADRNSIHETRSLCAMLEKIFVSCPIGYLPAPRISSAARTRLLSSIQPVKVGVFGLVGAAWDAWLVLVQRDWGQACATVRATKQEPHHFPWNPALLAGRTSPEGHACRSRQGCKSWRSSCFAATCRRNGRRGPVENRSTAQFPPSPPFPPLQPTLVAGPAGRTRCSRGGPGTGAL